METAKVDIRKLQTLNDCINRTIEALNQVRLSVHGAGLSHTAGIGAQGFGVPGYLGYQTTPYNSPFGIAPQLAQQVFGVAPTMGGIGHTAANLSPFAAGISPFGTGVSPFAAGVSPFAGNAAFPYYGQNAWTQNGWTQNGLGLGLGLGLGHTAADPRNGVEFLDPYVTTRIAQTFPFVNWGYSPFGWPNV
jgi:hypothetical protein